MTYTGAWGIGPWGLGPWGGAPSLSLLLLESTAFAIRENMVRLTFPAPLYVTGLGDELDALDVSHYRVEAVLGGTGLDGEPVREVRTISVLQPESDNASVMDLYVDRPFSRWPCEYVVDVRRIYLADGTYVPGPIRIQFPGTKLAYETNAPDLYKASSDIANPTGLGALLDPLPDPSEMSLGSFAYDDNGDYAADTGLESLKKRVIRRAITARDGFLWLPGYGVGLRQYGKRINGIALREKIRTELEDRISQEPDVAGVAVSLRYSDDAPEAVWFVARVQTTTGRQFEVGVPSGG